jgi:DNA-binding XRE family transcriptional regulator
MERPEPDDLARRGDTSKEAMAFRLRCARLSLEPPVSQKAMAARIGVTPQTYNNWEVGFAYPALTVTRWFHRRYRIDFNFLLHGDLAQLPHDVQESLLDAMRAEWSRLDRR